MNAYEMPNINNDMTGNFYSSNQDMNGGGQQEPRQQPDRKAQLKEAISHTMVNRFQQACDFREIQHLDDVIDDNEHIIQAVNGFTPSSDENAHYEWYNLGGSNGTGLIILTNKELIFFDHHLLFKSTSPSIPLRKINSITDNTGVIWGYIDVDNGAQTFRAEHILRWKCAPFVKAVNAQIDRVHYEQQHSQAQQNQQAQAQQQVSVDPVKQLQELNTMYAQHQISTTDYQKMKGRIING